MMMDEGCDIHHSLLVSRTVSVQLAFRMLGGRKMGEYVLEKLWPWLVFSPVYLRHAREERRGFGCIGSHQFITVCFADSRCSSFTSSIFFYRARYLYPSLISPFPHFERMTMSQCPFRPCRPKKTLARHATREKVHQPKKDPSTYVIRIPGGELIIKTSDVTISLISQTLLSSDALNSLTGDWYPSHQRGRLFWGTLLWIHLS